jgi:hypothetical protein
MSLTASRERVTGEFRRMNASLKRAADKLGATEFTGEPARLVLRELCGAFRYAIDCSAVDASGRMIAVEPAHFRRFEGSDISGQEQVVRVRKSRKPALSNVFRAVEGFDAVDAEYPVAAPDGRYVGSVSMLFSPAGLLESIIRPLTDGTPLKMRAVEKGGRVLYDTDVSLIGMNIFSSRQFRNNASFTDIVRHIMSAPEGSRSYPSSIRSGKGEAGKKVFWQSVSLYGTEWRLVGVHPESGASGTGEGGAGNAVAAERNLAALVLEKHFIEALAGGDKTSALARFRKFYEDTPGIYSIQWVDERGLNRFGYPAENSLTDYDYHTRRAPTDSATLKILDSRKPATMQAPLFEGGTGILTFRPVFSGERYLGTAYFIRILSTSTAPAKTASEARSNTPIH